MSSQSFSRTRRVVASSVLLAFVLGTGALLAAWKQNENREAEAASAKAAGAGGAGDARDGRAARTSPHGDGDRDGVGDCAPSR